MRKTCILGASVPDRVCGLSHAPSLLDLTGRLVARFFLPVLPCAERDSAALIRTSVAQKKKGQARPGPFQN